MLLVFEHATYRQERACCPKCSWSGAAAALRQGEYFFMSDMVEVYCPDCQHYVGFISLDPEEDYLESGVESRESALAPAQHPAAQDSRQPAAGGRQSAHP